jgi:hypothetical protein
VPLAAPPKNRPNQNSNRLHGVSAIHLLKSAVACDREYQVYKWVCAKAIPNPISFNEMHHTRIRKRMVLLDSFNKK